MRITARKLLVSALSQEILSRNENEAFLMPSEYTLCRRFQMSRVTVRLALSDLETRGLIYKRHGKGTFAHGQANRLRRGLAVLHKSKETLEKWPVSEMIRGLQGFLAAQQSPVTFLSSSPTEWSAELTQSLAGVVVLGGDVTPEDLQNLRDRNLGYYIVFPSPLAGPRIDLGFRKAAKSMTENLLNLGHLHLALITGYDPDLDASKREGIEDALRAAGSDPKAITEICFGPNQDTNLQALRNVLCQPNRPTGWIAFDDSLAVMLNFCARREGLSIPDDLSVASFHDYSFFHYIEPQLTTVGFQFFEAGRKAAESLQKSFLIGEALEDIVLEPIYREGQSVALPPSGP